MTNEEVLIRRSDAVRIHLDALDRLLQVPQPGAAEAVHASLSLRFLLDGALAQVAHGSGVPLAMAAPTLIGVPITDALMFACGGYLLGGRRVAPKYLYREPGPQSPHRPQYERQVANSPELHTLEEVRLGRFQRLPCLALLGHVLDREATVRYVANRCGGAHHHDNTKRFDEIDHRLTSMGAMLTVGDESLSVVFAETLGTAWFLMSAPSIVSLRTVLRG